MTGNPSHLHFWSRCKIWLPDELLQHMRGFRHFAPSFPILPRLLDGIELFNNFNNGGLGFLVLHHPSRSCCTSWLASHAIGATRYSTPTKGMLLLQLCELFEEHTRAAWIVAFHACFRDIRKNEREDAPTKRTCQNHDDIQNLRIPRHGLCVSCNRLIDPCVRNNSHVNLRSCLPSIYAGHPWALPNIFFWSVEVTCSNVQNGEPSHNLDDPTNDLAR